MAKIIGHRGFPRRYPENTIASFLGALLYGAHGVELDVRLSSDEELVVVHDPDLKRIAGRHIVVRETRLAELKKIHIGMGQVIPTLGEVFDAIPRGYEVFVEVKEVEAAERSLRLVEEKKRLGDVVFISFSEEALRIIRRLNPEARIGLNLDSIEKAERALVLIRELGLNTVNPPVEAIDVVGLERLAGYLEKVHRLGAGTVLWTVNEVGIVEKLSGLLDYIITDDPALFNREARSRQRPSPSPLP